MTFARRLLLVGTDHRFSQIVQTHLHKTFLLTAPVLRPADISAVVDRRADGVLMCLAADPAQYDELDAAVRQLKLRALPARVVVVESNEWPASRRGESRRAYHDAHFEWQDDLRDLNAWVRKGVTPGTPFVDYSHETPLELVRRRLGELTPSLSPLAEQVCTAAAHDVAVLIEGEAGTGKSHLARLIHDCSPRAAHKYLAVACGSLAGTALAAELFGRQRGPAGDSGTKTGKFAAAGPGTLLLDEIDTLPLDLQANLLRLIETGEYEPVGSPETFTSQARLVAATNWSLAEAVERGTFRRDLYYRLHVATFHLTPLRARPQDIAPLVRGMAARYAARFRKPLVSVAPEVIRAAEAFAWPGNIRQLENLVQQAVLTSAGESLTLADVPGLAHPGGADPQTTTPAPAASSLAQNRESAERAVIIRALEKVAFSRTRAAELLGVSRVTLYKKMKKYGLFPKPGAVPHGYFEFPPAPATPTGLARRD